MCKPDTSLVEIQFGYGVGPFPGRGLDIPLSHDVDSALVGPWRTCQSPRVIQVLLCAMKTRSLCREAARQTEAISPPSLLNNLRHTTASVGGD